MPHVSVRTAAQLIGKDRSTVLRAIKSGDLTANRDEHGRFEIDPAELERAFGKLRSPASHAAADTAAMTQHAPADAVRAAALEREVALLREMQQQWRETQRQWEEERTFLRGLVDKQAEQVRMLTDQRERHSPTLWAWLWRRSS
jgi:hypothetical protein